ncbi:MAG: ATPase [Jatrophihabitantaceae bacterium]|nr:ATPase [Jatrophihabitantaceae bacterium]
MTASLGAPAASPHQPASPDELATALASVGYLADDALATTAYLALDLGRPLFVEGDPGTGKTALALALAESLGAPLIRLQCYEGLRVEQALYDWDFPRQLLHLRVAEATGRAEEVEGELYSRRFLLARPIVEALEQSTAECRSVLLIDEIDRADDEFDAMLLEVLADSSVTIPELGTITAARPPVVVLTSNRTREVHDALKRRCLYAWVDHPSAVRELAIVRSRLPEVADALAQDVVTAVRRLRGMDLVKPPGVSETLDWARSLHALGVRSVDEDSLAATLGAAVKYREDTQRVHELGLMESLIDVGMRRG